PKHNSTGDSRSRPPLPTRSNDVQVEKLKHEVAELRKTNAQLESNLMLLYKTSHHLLTLKDNELTKLKNKYDAMCFRRNREQDSIKSLPSIAPQVSSGPEIDPNPPEPKQLADQPFISVVSEITSKRDMREELAMLRNYLPRHTRRRTSESSCRSRDSTEGLKGQGGSSKRSHEFEEQSRQYKENSDADYNISHEWKRDNRRECVSDRGKATRKDDRDRPERDKRSHREGYGKDTRERKFDRDRRQWRRSPEPFHGRRDAGNRYRKRRLEKEIENPKRQRRQDRRTPEDLCKLPSAKNETEEVRRKERWSSDFYSADGKPTGVSSDAGTCRSAAKQTERVADVPRKDELARPTSPVEAEGPREKTPVFQKANIDDNELKEDGEISDAETDNSQQVKQELRRSPRKCVRSKDVPVPQRAMSLELKSDDEKSKQGGRSSRVRSRSSNTRTRHRTPTAERTPQEKGLDGGPRTPTRKRSREIDSPGWSVQESSGSLRGRSKATTPKKTPLGKRSPYGKQWQSSEADNSFSNCITPSLRRSPRKTMREHFLEIVIRSPHTSNFSPAKSESPRKQSILRSYPCKIPMKTSNEVDDPRNSKKMEKRDLLIVIRQYLMEESEETSPKLNGQGVYRNSAEGQLEIEAHLPREPRSLTKGPVCTVNLQASSSSSNDLTCLDLLPIKQRNSLNSDNEKPKTPTLSPLFSPMMPGEAGGVNTGTPTVLAAGTGSFGEWHDVNFTPFDPSMPPETPGKDITLGTPVTTTSKNGKSAEDIGRILHFDKVTYSK
ncbi:hypothetical protein BIW11_10870, partial [Tropilaelaps mercedesae]